MLTTSTLPHYLPLVIFQYTHAAHLANDPGPESITITCPNSGQNGQSHTGWSLSPGGGDSGLPLDTSPSKYTLTSSNSLTISNINGTDEGLYRCVYGDSGSVRYACIYVYGEFIQQQIKIVL